jgi:hypothetical protein
MNLDYDLDVETDKISQRIQKEIEQLAPAQHAR